PIRKNGRRRPLPRTISRFTRLLPVVERCDHFGSLPGLQREVELLIKRPHRARNGSFHRRQTNAPRAEPESEPELEPWASKVLELSHAGGGSYRSQLGMKEQQISCALCG